jgi:hypothetical protein
MMRGIKSWRKSTARRLMRPMSRPRLLLIKYSFKGRKFLIVSLIPGFFQRQE